MPRNIPHRFRAAAAVCLALAILSALAWILPAVGTPAASAQGGQSLFVRKIALRANDVVYSPSTNMLYASVPSAAGTGGNTVTPIDPATGAVGTPVFVGSEPNRLALGDDGRTLYTYLDGAKAVRRFDLQTQTAGLQFTAGTQIPADMEVMPGSPQTLAVSPGVDFSTGVTLYDDGVACPKTGRNGNFYAVLPIEFGSPSVLYGYDSYSSGFELVKFGVASDGVTTSAVTNNLISGYSSDIDYAGGLLYSSLGRVVDPEARKLVGTFDAAGGVFTVDHALGRAFFLTGDGFGGDTKVLKAYDLNTFLLIGQATFQIPGAPTRLVRWGSNGLALRVGSVFGSNTNESALYVLQSALVSSSQPIPVGLQFSNEKPTAFEFNSPLNISVTRSGDLSQPTTVNYSTADGTATAGSDYTAASGTLNFAEGEASKTFTVAITNDPNNEPDETVSLALSAPTGGALLGTTSIATVTLDSDDATPGPNPVGDGFNAEFFVRQHYHDFLNREPDTPGLAFWTGEITQCGSDAACAEVKKVNVSAAFFLSIEFQETGYFVYRLHQAAYDTRETLRWRTFLADTQEIGRGVEVGIGDWKQKLEANKKAFVDRFVTSPAFAAYQPLTNSEYVDQLLFHTFDPLNPGTGYALTEAERAALIADLDQSRKTRTEALRAVAENPEFARRQSNQAFVLMQYYGYLRRNPNDPPDANFDGYDFWLGKLREFGGNYLNAEMVKAFITSDEYRKRFGQ